MKNIINKTFQIIRQKGIWFCAYRLSYALRKRTGLLKNRFKTPKWDDIKISDSISSNLTLNELLNNGGKFFFEKGNPPKYDIFKSQTLIESADNISDSRFQYFFNEFKSLGDKPDWFLNPFTGSRGDGKSHWCDIADFDNRVGDIKFIWEPSRFAWAYTLARAYNFTSDEKYADRFWQLFESWLENNPPNTGSNYMCGQECAIRVMAMCFALFVFFKSEASSKIRIEKLFKAIVLHAERIEKNISFAISTSTNHSITEAAGIYTVGLLFPFLKKSYKWKNKGRKILIQEGLKQIYKDGSYIQHSMNYHRLMLQNYIWVFRLAELNAEQFPSQLTDRVKKAVEFIYQLQDEKSGRVSNYGANDGAIIMPFNSCDYLDYRPVIQSGFYLFNKTKLYESGLWYEDLLWLFGREAVETDVTSVTRKDLCADSGGYYTIRNKDNFAMFRCHSFKDRPGHSDMLTVDLWWDGVNVLRDSGSYMYNCSEKWLRYFMGSRSHNTISVDDADQMTKGNLWNWFDWTKSEVFQIENRDNIKIMSGQHYGFRRINESIVHKRTVYSNDSYWIIVDDITGAGKHKIELNWQLAEEALKSNQNSFLINSSSGKIFGFVYSDKKLEKM